MIFHPEAAWISGGTDERRRVRAFLAPKEVWPPRCVPILRKERLDHRQKKGAGPLHARLGSNEYDWGSYALQQRLTAPEATGFRA